MPNVNCIYHWYSILFSNYLFSSPGKHYLNIFFTLQIVSYVNYSYHQFIILFINHLFSSPFKHYLNIFFMMQLVLNKNYKFSSVNKNNEYFTVANKLFLFNYIKKIILQIIIIFEIYFCFNVFFKLSIYLSICSLFRGKQSFHLLYWPF